MAGNNIMGRTVKISELKEFDVFRHNDVKLYEGKQYCFVGLDQFINIEIHKNGIGIIPIIKMKK